MTTLPPSAEALLADLADIQETRYDVAFRWVSDALAKVITEATAQQAAEMAELRRAIAMTTQAFEEDVARLRAALEEAIGEAHCPSTAGGTEGRWCLNHDTPMVNEDRCSMVEGWLSALAAAPAVAPAPNSAPNPPEYRHSDRADDESHAPTPDPASPCDHPTCNERAIAHVHMKKHGVHGRHPHIATRCATCGHAIEPVKEETHA